MAELLVSFPEADLSTANRLAAELEEAVSRVVPQAEIGRVREDPAAQDFGAIIEILLASAAAREVARGIGNWIEKRPATKIRLRKTTPEGSSAELEIEGRVGARTFEEIVSFLEDR